MSESIEDRARRVVAEVFDLPLAEVTTKTSKSTVKSWDSVNMVNLMMALETEFEISFTVDEAAELLSMQSILALLRDKGAR